MSEHELRCPLEEGSRKGNKTGALVESVIQNIKDSKFPPWSLIKT